MESLSRNSKTLVCGRIYSFLPLLDCTPVKVQLIVLLFADLADNKRGIIFGRICIDYKSSTNPTTFDGFAIGIRMKGKNRKSRYSIAIAHEFHNLWIIT